MSTQAVPDDAKPFARAPAPTPIDHGVAPVAQPMLGWFAIALGFAQVLVPRALARMGGARRHSAPKALVRAIGAREVVSGLGLLVWPRSAAFAWLRVLGDAMDLAVLGRAMLQSGASMSARTRTAMSIAAVSGVAVVDVKTARALSRAQRATVERNPMKIIKCITVHKSPDEVRKLWSSVVESADPSDRVIVRFTPARMGRATEVRVEMLDVPAGGVLFTALAKLTGMATRGDLDRALKQFKQIAELGEVVHSDASIHDGPHPARPSANHDDMAHGDENEGEVRS
jgi:uncharacterized membrane protein